MVLLLGLTLARRACGRRDRSGSATATATASVQQKGNADPTDAELIGLEDRLADGYRRRDAQGPVSLLSPEYYGNGGDFEWDHDALLREFPKIQLADLQVERRHVKRVAPDLVQINSVQTMYEVYDGLDISGRYWTSDLWARRDGKWLLLVEQEVPLPKAPVVKEP